MAILGVHMSIAGGLAKAVQRAADAGCDCVQIFTAAPQQWPFDGVDPASADGARQAKELPEADCRAFRESLSELGIGHPISHDSYLINLASPTSELWAKSIDALVIELRRADALGIPYVVAHPGSYTTSSEAAGLTRIAAGLDEVHRQTPGIAARVLLETTAGQGTNLGEVADPDRLGVCFDTCHVFAAGYPLGSAEDYRTTMYSLDQTVGCALVKAFHLNDSLKPIGSRKDRHAGIGAGEMGVEPFRHLLNDDRFHQIPMYLETPKGDRDGEDLDTVNLRTLRSLIAT